MATSTVEQETVPVAVPVPAYLEDAARLLEQAIKAGCHEPEVAYMLAVCYKKEGKPAEARAALRKIARPDANVLLQMGLLSLEEQQYAQAEQEFAQSLQADPGSYDACYNLLLARLALGNLAGCQALLPQLLSLAPNADEQRFFGLLEPLLRIGANTMAGVPPPMPKREANGQLVHEALMPAMAPMEEQRLLEFIRGLGQFDVIFPLLRTLATAAPHSPVVQEAFLEAVLVQAKKLADRCQWEAAEQLLAPLSRGAIEGQGGRSTSRSHQVALLNLLGVCECMLQDFDRGTRYFAAALKLAGNDAWLHQNMALAYELQGRLEQADTHWNRYFDLLDGKVPVPPLPNYLENLAYEGLNRLADAYQKKERWSNALQYLQRANRLRPQDPDTLERLFHLYAQVKRPEDARRTLRRLREMRPDDPQFELYELDLREVRTLEDIDRMLSDIRKTLSRHPGDVRVEERAVNMVGNVIPLMGRMCDQLTDQLGKIVDQVRRLPNYQINWPAVRDVMRDLHDEFQKLRRITNKCLSLVTSEEHRRIIRELSEHIDRKIELCQSMGG
ncbi:MAG TPA: tetratricopeptide repeat protein [Gemmataceae bacterium]|nr:tetratricopeptide repeat protein [Gemmataceae bacterium]